MKIGAGVLIVVLVTSILVSSTNTAFLSSLLLPPQTAFKQVLAQTTYSPSVNEASQYLLYQNSEYGFSIKYPSDWYHEEKTPQIGVLSPVAFFAPTSTSSNVWLAINYEKDSTELTGLTSQQILNKLVQSMAQNCASDSFQSNGFTCSNQQFKTNVGTIGGFVEYTVISTWIKTQSNSSTDTMASVWMVIPAHNDLYTLDLRTSSGEANLYLNEMTYMAESFNIYNASQETVQTQQPVQTSAPSIPGWIKNNAKWWAEGSLADDDFIKGIQYLIQQRIITVPTTQVSSNPSQTIPAWIKNTAKWWADGQVGDSDFIQGIQYLVQNGIISTTIAPQTHDTANQVIGTSGGTVSLSDGSSVDIPAGALTSDQSVSLKLLSSLPQQPPSGIIVGVGPALVITFGPTQTSYQRLSVVPSASAQTQSSGTINVTLNLGKIQSTDISGSVGIADAVDLQGKDHFVGIPEDCDQSYTSCTFALEQSVLTNLQKITLSQVNLNSQITGEVAPRWGPRIWNGQEFVNFPQGFDPAKKTLVLIHGMASNVESAYGDCINELMARGNYEQVIGFDYDFTKDINYNGHQFANFLDLLKQNNVSQIDLEAHSEGTVVALAAASFTSMKINNMILEGGPIDGTPIASYGLTTVLANSPVPLPIFGNSLKEMYENGVMSQLQPGSQILQTIKNGAVNNQPATNFIKVVGTSPFLLERGAIIGSGVVGGAMTSPLLAPLISLTVDPFSGQPNDGMIPVSSAEGQGLPGPVLHFSTNHTDLTCNPDVLIGVANAVNQHPLPSSSQSTTGSTGEITVPSTTPQGQSQRGCAGYRTCEDYCQFEYGSDYHYDASTNSCVQTSQSMSGSSSSGGNSGGSSSSGTSSSSGSGSMAGWFSDTWTATFQGTFTSSDPNTPPCQESGEMILTISSNDGITASYNTYFPPESLKANCDADNSLSNGASAQAEISGPWKNPFVASGPNIMGGTTTLSANISGNSMTGTITGSGSDGKLQIQFTATK